MIVLWVGISVLPYTAIRHSFEDTHLFKPSSRMNYSLILGIAQVRVTNVESRHGAVKVQCPC